MAVVVDASVALAWLVPSQSTAAAEAFRASAAAQTLLAPEVFRVEARHALVKLERRSLAGPEALNAGLPALEALFSITAQTSAEELVGVVALARAEQLGVYDAFYLSLALASRAALASRDSVLLAAAARRGVMAHDLR